MSKELILMIEGDQTSCLLMHKHLGREGFRTADAPNAKEGLALHLKLKPDLIILNMSLPDRSGYEVLSEIRRRSNTPVIAVRERGESIDELKSLVFGSNDYLTKPFDWDVLVIRINNVLKTGGDQTGDRPIRVGILTVDHSAHTVSVDQPTGPKVLNLTPREFSLIACMARHAGRVYGRDELIDYCWPDHVPLHRTVDSHMCNLRSKLDAAGARCMLITVRGVGYKLGNENG
ncbi:response regulator transcription factor [Rhizobium leguminosarum]|uniref:response regulator transcription factor n=1 Tax=Rhizobium leguminosarum TaxID=384 RepID=UPI001F309C37|nr:response regulator transcription factor [Rhizobium leguminosarum]UIJ82266.1 response regulator transcription factor [Rhizobium leguminosarum]